MADSVILSDGTTDYEFVYDAASQADFKLHYGLKVEAGEPDVLWHRPDNGSPKLIRLKNQPRTVFLTKNVYGDDWDDVINTIAPIKRWIDGEDQQAARYHADGDVDKIYLRIQLDGMTNYTDATVIYGDVDDSGSYYTPASILNKRALGVVIMLVVEPLGEGAAITLRNDLASSPHFLEDSNSDGLADGWTAVGTPTTNISVVNYLIGGKAQQIATDTSTNEGIRASVTASSSTQAVAYVWLRGLTSGGLFGDPVTINLTDGSDVSIQSKTFNPTTPTGYDKTATGASGTWYRYVLSGTNTNANFRFYISRTASSATKVSNFVIDGAYLQTGTTTAPDAWCSTSAIRNRYDPTSSNEERINYVDVWGVPGDSDALVKIYNNPAGYATSPKTMILSTLSDGKYLVADYKHFIDSDEFSTSAVSGGVTISTQSGTVSGGNYIRLTSPSSATNTTTIYYRFSTDAARLQWGTPLRAFGLIRNNNTTPTIASALYRGFVSHQETTQSLPNTGGNWEIIDLGLIDARGLYPDDIFDPDTYPGSGNAEYRITIEDIPTSSATFEIDGVWLFPAGKEIVICRSDDYSVAGFYTTAVPPTVQTPQGVLLNPSGHITSVVAGNKMTRFVLFVFGTSSDDEVFTLTETGNFTFYVTPRTRHLLGTT